MVRVCCGLAQSDFEHTFQGYFIGAGSIISMTYRKTVVSLVC